MRLFLLQSSIFRVPDQHPGPECCRGGGPRAGEQGHGCAVVATEVLGMAQRSAQAAREISAPISASVQKASQGGQLADDAGRTMAEIVGSIQRVSAMMGEIHTAARDQSAGIAQVNQSVGLLDQMTQQNAALVEESAAAATTPQKAWPTCWPRRWPCLYSSHRRRVSAAVCVATRGCGFVMWRYHRSP